MTKKRDSAIGYNRLARWYRPLEWILFGNELQRARTALVDRLPNVSRGLVLGDGDGRLLERLVRSQDRCEFVSIDQSVRMIEKQKRRTQTQGGESIQFVCDDATQSPLADNRFDLLVTSFFLDCFSKEFLQTQLPIWINAIEDGGLVYLVDFVHPDHGWRRIQSHLYQRIMHQFFRWQTGLPNRELVDLDPILRSLPLELLTTATGLHPMMTCRIYQKRSRRSAEQPVESSDHSTTRISSASRKPSPLESS